MKGTNIDFKVSDGSPVVVFEYSTDIRAAMLNKRICSIWITIFPLSNSKCMSKKGSYRYGSAWKCFVREERSLSKIGFSEASQQH